MSFLNVNETFFFMVKQVFSVVSREHHTIVKVLGYFMKYFQNENFS